MRSIRQVCSCGTWVVCLSGFQPKQPQELMKPGVQSEHLHAVAQPVARKRTEVVTYQPQRSDSPRSVCSLSRSYLKCDVAKNPRTCLCTSIATRTLPQDSGFRTLNAQTRLGVASSAVLDSRRPECADEQKIAPSSSVQYQYNSRKRWQQEDYRPHRLGGLPPERIIVTAVGNTM
jgi:hypothetical protein